MHHHDLLFKIDKEQHIEMLMKNWMSHDARWQISVVKKLGWDLGNKLNQEVTREMGKIIMFRLMKILGISRVDNINELRNMIVTTITSNFSKAMEKNQVKCKSDTSILIEINNCIIYNNIKKVNATDKYECGCFALRFGFCDALKLVISQECNKCLMKGDNKCEIVLNVKKW